jgi:hypothetical protein
MIRLSERAERAVEGSTVGQCRTVGQSRNKRGYATTVPCEIERGAKASGLGAASAEQGHSAPAASNEARTSRLMPGRHFRPILGAAGETTSMNRADGLKYMVLTVREFEAAQPLDFEA